MHGDFRSYLHVCGDFRCTKCMCEHGDFRLGMVMYQFVSVMYHLCESWTSFSVVMVAFVCNDETLSANMELLMLPVDACQTIAISTLSNDE
jgi:hypothetical protein